MKSLSLRTYSRYYLQKRYGSLKVREMAQVAETTHHRLYPALLVYAFFMDSQDDWFSGKLQYHLAKMRQDKTEKTDEAVITYMRNTEDMDLVKFCDTFRGANQRRDETDFKNTYRDALKRLKDEKRLSEYRLCKMAEANPGNFSAFMKGDNSKLSSEKLVLALERAYEYVSKD